MAVDKAVNRGDNMTKKKPVANRLHDAIEDLHHLVWALKHKEPVADTNLESIMLLRDFMHGIIFPGPHHSEEGLETDTLWVRHNESVDALIADIEKRWGKDMLEPKVDDDS